MTVGTQDFAIKTDSKFLLYQDLLGGLLISVVASAGLAFGFQHTTLNNDKLYWFIVMALVLTARFVDWLCWQRTKRLT